MMNWILNNGKTLKLNFKDQNGSSPLLKSTSLCSPKMIYNFMKTEGITLVFSLSVNSRTSPSR